MTLFSRRHPGRMAKARETPGPKGLGGWCPWALHELGKGRGGPGELAPAAAVGATSSRPTRATMMYCQSWHQWRCLETPRPCRRVAGV